jgi:uncharacterized protein (UPF0335 family)
MARIAKSFKIELNSSDNLRDLLQQIYDLADGQIVQIQSEIEKLKNSTDLTQESMDGKSRYAKAINDYLTVKDKTLSKKIEVARLLSEVMAHNGDVKKTMEDTSSQKWDVNAMRSMIDEVYENKNNTNTKTINLKK